MIDPLDRVLMAKLEFADWTGWVLPGGGVEPGEDHLQTLKRELAEETGVPELFVGPQVFLRRHLSSAISNGFDGQEETVYLVPCHQFDVDPGLPMEQLRAEGLTELRWWTKAEMAATTETLVPEGLAEIVAIVLEFGAPASPILLEEIDDM